MRIFVASAAVVAIVAVGPSVAHAQDADDAEILRQSKEHYRLGLEAFKAGKYPDAIKELKKAYLLKRLPPFLMNIAKTYEKLKDTDNAVYYYKKYLAEAPPDAKDRDQAKQALVDIQNHKSEPEDSNAAENLPEAAGPSRRRASAEPPQEEEAPPPVKKAKRPPVQEEPVAEEEPPPPPVKKKRPVVAQEEAPEASQEEAPPPVKKSKRPPVVEEAPAEETPPPVAKKGRRGQPVEEEAAPSSGGAAATEWSHVTIDSAPPNTPVDVRVQTPVMKGVKVYLYYREPGTAEFKVLEMKRHGSEKLARIPGDAMNAKSIQYYIEAKDKTGAVVKNSGTQIDPNIVMIEAGAPPQIVRGGGAGASEETDSAGGSTETASPRRGSHSSDDEAAPLARRSETPEEAPLEEPAPKPTRKGPPPPTFDGLGWAGIGLIAGGVAVGAGGGAAAGVYMMNYQNLVFNDATSQDAAGSPNCRTQANNPPGSPKPYSGRCYFNDPVFAAGQADIDYQAKGKLAGTLVPVFAGVGGAMVAAGIGLTVYDYLKLHSSSSSSKNTRRRPTPATRPRPTPRAAPSAPRDEASPPPEATRPPAPAAEEKAAPDSAKPAAGAKPPADESPSDVPQSSIRNLIISPAVSPTSVGLGASFNW